MTITPTLEAALTRLAAERTPNPDENFEPITQQDIDRLRKLITHLPDDLPEPDVISAGTDGMPSLEWFRPWVGTFEAWVPKHENAVAWIWFRKDMGEEPLTDQPPEKFISVLRAFLS